MKATVTDKAMAERDNGVEGQIGKPPLQTLFDTLHFNDEGFAYESTSDYFIHSSVYISFWNSFPIPCSLHFNSSLVLFNFSHNW